MTRSRTLRIVLVGALAVAAGTAAVALPLMASAASTGYEAESATISQGVVASDHTGFTGTGFVDYTNVTGSYVEFTVTAPADEAATLTFRFANGTTTNRPMDISVNGATGTATNFAGTGNWTTWKTMNVSANLVAGANTIRATATTSNGGPNLDSLTVLDGGGTPSSPPPTSTGTDWSITMANSIMAQHTATSLSWSYPNGLYLYGQYLTYQRLAPTDPNKAKYLTYLRAWADHYIDSSGHISNSFGSLDSMQPGVVYLALYEATGAAKYKAAATQIEQRLEHSNYPRVDGALQHATSTSRANQLWGDGTFMAVPFLARYENQIGDGGIARTDAINNMITYAKHLQRPDGILWHAYDSKATQSWVVPGTNHSPESWCRAMGWFSMASIMVLDATPANTPNRGTVISNLQKLAAGVKSYQDPNTGRWFEVVDKGAKSDNWLETSCSSMFTYMFSRGVAQGYLSPDLGYQGAAAKGYQGVLAKVSLDGSGHIQLADVVEGTNVGNYAYYIGRTRSATDFHGFGSFMIMNEQLRNS